MQFIREHIYRQFGSPWSPVSSMFDQSPVTPQDDASMSIPSPISPTSSSSSSSESEFCRSPSSDSALEVEICTPLDFSESNAPLDLPARPSPSVELGPDTECTNLTINTTTSSSTALESDVDADADSLTLDTTFTLDSDEDTDSEDADLDDMDIDAEGDSDSECEEAIVTSPHESLMFFPPAPPVSVPSMLSPTYPHNNSHMPIDPYTGFPLPPISSIPAYCLRGYGGVESEKRGTPARVCVEAKGDLEGLRRGRRGGLWKNEGVEMSDGEGC